MFSRFWKLLLFLHEPQSLTEFLERRIVFCGLHVMILAFNPQVATLEKILVRLGP